MSLKRLLPILLLCAPFTLAALPGCSAEVGDGEVEEAGSGDDHKLSDQELGESLEAVSEAAGGPTNVAFANNSAAVWDIRNQWAEKDTTDAKRAGIAWPANSGLTWEEKYQAWFKSFKIIPAEVGGWGGNSKTWEFSTPFGKVIKAGVFECADTAMVMRVLFASWYGLPFYMTGWNSRGNRSMYAGHFGFVTKEDTPVGGFPTFRTLYKDMTNPPPRKPGSRSRSMPASPSAKASRRKKKISPPKWRKRCKADLPICRMRERGALAPLFHAEQRLPGGRRRQGEAIHFSII